MSVRRRVPAPLKRALRPARRVVQRRRQLATVAATGVFDLEWYEAQTGLTFTSPRAAIRHYLGAPRRDGLSPHPLFEAEWVDPDRWLRRELDPFVWFLTSSSARGRETHPLLPGLPGRSSSWVDHVRGLRPDSEVGPEGGPTARWDTVRARLLEAAAEHRRQVALTTVPRIQDTLPPVDAVVARHRGEAPLVSVVLPTWNRAHLLRRAIESVRAQSYENWQLIVVDDGSSDDTEHVLRGITTFEHRVSVVRVDHVGVCRARNAGLAAARGRYVAFLDSDNEWLPGYLEAMVAQLEAHGWEMAHAAMRINDGESTRYRCFEGDLRHLLVANHVDLNVLVVRRDLLETVGGFDESLRRAVDYDLVLRLAEVAPLHAVPVIGADYTEDRDDLTRISVSEPHSWNSVVRERHLVAALGPAPETVPGRVSVVLPVRRNVASTVRWLTSRTKDGWGADDVETVVVGSGISRAHLCLAAGLAAVMPATTVLRTPSHVGSAVATNIGLARCSGGVVVFARPNTTPAAQWLAPLAAALEDPSVGVVQPLLTNVDGTVSTAGAVFSPGGPYPSPLLGGLTLADARRMGSGEVPAAFGGVLALRTSDARGLHGLDPLLDNTFSETDLSLRALEAGVGRTVVAVERPLTARSPRRFGFEPDPEGSMVVLRARWSSGPPGTESVLARAGFDVVGHQSVRTTTGRDGSSVVIGRRPVPAPARAQVVESAPRLRWTIDTASPSGPRGEMWGDTHFARALALSLERLGQQVSVDSRDARQRPSRDDDDVLLVLRGLDVVQPPPGRVSIEWVISHPELVTAREAAGFDAVFAASVDWSTRHTARWGVQIDPLLQCTDPALFRPDRGEPDSGPPLLFVGNSRKVNRPMVQAAVAASADVHVYGQGWDGLIDPVHVKGLGIPNDELGAHYAAATLVLNDHWEDMRCEGFLSNRLFDAVAAGARVVSDDVPGLADVFGSSVAVVRSTSEMQRLLGRPFHESFPTLEQRRVAARSVHAQHSFDRRAEQLLERACRLWARETPGMRRIDGTDRRR